MTPEGSEPLAGGRANHIRDRINSEAVHDEFFVPVMAANPKPNKAVGPLSRQCSHSQIYTRRPEFADFLESQGGVARGRS